MNFDIDAFSHGPIESKLWLCEQIKQKVTLESVDNVVVLGSWNGTMAFLLYVTRVLKFDRIFLIDPNTEYQTQARGICNSLDCQGRLVIIEQDANTYDYPQGNNLVINTSTDNIAGSEWFERIPKFSWVILQARTGPHRDRVRIFETAKDFDLAFPMRYSHPVATKEFVYPDHQYTRFMKIGIC